MPGLSLAPDTVPSPLANVDQQTDQFTQKMDTARSNAAAVPQKTDEKLQKVEKAREGLTPPEMQSMPPPPKPENTSPAEAWGSLAMLAAALGGAKSRLHATTALNAAASVLQGFHQRDKEKFEADYSRWKAANDNMIKYQNFELNTYKAIMAGLASQGREAIGAGNVAAKTAATDVHAIALSFSDSVMAEKAAAHDVQGMIKLIQDREKLMERMEEQSGKLEQSAALHNALLELRNSDAYKSADPIKRYGMELALAKQKTPEMDNRGDGSPNDLKIARVVYQTQFVVGGVVQPDAPKFDEWYERDWPNWAGGPSVGAQSANGPYKKGDSVQTKDGKTVYYKGTGDWQDRSNWSDTPPNAQAAPSAQSSPPAVPQPQPDDAASTFGGI